MKLTMSEIIAGQATGCTSNPKGLGRYYDNQGNELTEVEAQDRLYEGGTVEVPNAGAGSYRRFFRAMGLAEVREIQTCSSAGDWDFAVKDGDVWRVASQSNRFPRHGFTYSISADYMADSFEELCRVCFE